MDHMMKEIAEAPDDASRQATAVGCMRAADALNENPFCNGRSR
jgi:hypothetical protein